MDSSLPFSHGENGKTVSFNSIEWILACGLVQGSGLSRPFNSIEWIHSVSVGLWGWGTGTLSFQFH